MSLSIEGTALTILGKTYQIKCAENEIAPLQKAAEYVEERLLKIRSTTGLLSVDRIAVITALQIAYEFLGQKTQDRMQALQGQIDTFIQQLELPSSE